MQDHPRDHLVLVGSRSLAQEGLSVLLGDTGNTVRQRELDAVAVELLSGSTASLAGRDFINRNDLDTAETSSVATSEILVQLLNSTNSGGISVLFVHVVGASLAVVSQDNTVVLDGEGVLLKNLINRDDFTTSLLDLVLTRKEVPETALSKDGALGKEGHSVDGRLGSGLCGKMASNNLVLVVSNVRHFPFFPVDAD